MRFARQIAALAISFADSFGLTSILLDARIIFEHFTVSTSHGVVDRISYNREYGVKVSINVMNSPPMAVDSTRLLIDNIYMTLIDL